MEHLPVSEKASEYPKRIHWMATTAYASMARKRMLSAFLDVERPLYNRPELDENTWIRRRYRQLVSLA
jgi:hypothetical protein